MNLPRNVVLAGLALATLACGDARPQLQPDASSSDASDASDVETSELRVHYHRADRDYAASKLTLVGDTPNTTISSQTVDGFGAVFRVPLSRPAEKLTLSFGQGATPEPLAPVEIDLKTTGEIWYFSGSDEVLLRRPPAIPGENQVAIYYKRRDALYDSWGLHLWGDVQEPTAWMGPARPLGTDEEFGAYWLVDLKPAAMRVNVIVHQGDEKDPGPDMGWDLADLGDIVFLRTGSTEISPRPVDVPAFAISGAEAHWIDRGTLAWNYGGKAATRFELRSSENAEVHVEGTDVVGGQVLALSPLSGAISGTLAADWPHLARHKAFSVVTSSAVDLLRSQLVAVARDDAGTALAATFVQTPGALDDLLAYDGSLGLTWSGPQRPRHVRVWAPTAQAVRLVRFDTNLAELESLAMTSSTSGTWVIDALPTWYGTYYQFEVKAYHYTTDRIETLRTTDPYSVALSPNGRHSFIVDLDDPNTKPADWDGLVKPDRVQAPEDISIYELHVRDFSIDDATVPEAHRGKFLAFTHNGVTQPDTSRGVAHLKTLSSAGLTVVQFLPSFDYATVDELPSQRVDITDRFDRLCSVNPEVPAALCAQNRTKTIKEVLAGFEPTSPDAQALMQYIRPFDGFNWGYDPLHYSAPEGGYATDPFGGKRIWEMRSAVKALAEIGLRISLDVVYNHTNASGTGDQAVLDRLVPGYYHRRNINTGNVEQSTCCANTATEHRMMEKLMIDSLLVWARAYKVDAFRFDLMGHHMKRNMTKALATLQALTPARDGVDGSKIYFYGEGWNFGEVATNARGVNATQLNMNGTGIGTFSDRLRDAVRGGGAFDSGRALVSNQGFISGLFYDPNTPDKMPAADARAKLLIAGDQIKVGLAGNLRSFRVTTYMGSTVAGSLVAYSGQPTGYTDDPQEVITYVDKHDNQTLFDISAYKTPANTDMATRARIQALGISFVALGQGVPFFHAGMEILRSKSMERDSYDSGDWWNALDYSLESTRWNVGLPREDKDGGNWDTIRGLCQDRSIAPTRVHLERTRDHFLEMLSVRASSPLFRLRTADDVKRRVDFANVGPAQTPGLIAMTITDGACAGADLDPVFDAFAVFFNATTAPQTIELPGAAGFVLHPVLAASTDPVVRTATASSGQFTIPARTTAVFVSPQHGAQGAGLPCNER